MQRKYPRMQASLLETVNKADKSKAQITENTESLKPPFKNG